MWDTLARGAGPAAVGRRYSACSLFLFCPADHQAPALKLSRSCHDGAQAAERGHGAGLAAAGVVVSLPWAVARRPPSSNCRQERRGGGPRGGRGPELSCSPTSSHQRRVLLLPAPTQPPCWCQINFPTVQLRLCVVPKAASDWLLGQGLEAALQASCLGGLTAGAWP